MNPLGRLQTTKAERLDTAVTDGFPKLRQQPFLVITLQLLQQRGIVDEDLKDAAPYSADPGMSLNLLRRRFSPGLLQFRLCRPARVTVLREDRRQYVADLRRSTFGAQNQPSLIRGITTYA